MAWTPGTGDLTQPCQHLTLHRIEIAGQPYYQCGACDKIFVVPAAETIVVKHG